MMKKLTYLLLVMFAVVLISTSCEKDDAVPEESAEEEIRNYDIPVSSSLDIMHYWMDMDSEFYFDLSSTTKPIVNGESFYCYIDKMPNVYEDTNGYMYLFKTEKDYKDFIDRTVYNDEIEDEEKYQYYSIEFDFNDIFSWKTVRFVNTNNKNYFCERI